MYKKVIEFLAIASIVLVSCAQTSAREGSSLLWKVSGNGLEKPSYLFGTHHLIPIAFLDSVNGLEEAFEATEQTIGELDLSDMAELQMKLLGESQMPQGVTYDSLISLENRALLDSTLTSLIGIGLGQLGQMKPAILSNLISVTLYQKYYPTLSGEKSSAPVSRSALVNQSRFAIPNK